MQPHHDAREVFSTQDELSEDFDVVHGPAAVCQPGEYMRMADAGDDVYLCEYEYDTAFRVRHACMWAPRMRFTLLRSLQVRR